jgi:hypothetical protein
MQPRQRTKSLSGLWRQAKNDSPPQRDGATIVTPKAEEYSAKARECEERAEKTRDPFIKQQLMEIALKWRTMAAYEEKYAR